jgi:hypothetical protein
MDRAGRRSSRGDPAEAGPSGGDEVRVETLHRATLRAPGALAVASGPRTCLTQCAQLTLRTSLSLQDPGDVFGRNFAGASRFAACLTCIAGRVRATLPICHHHHHDVLHLQQPCSAYSLSGVDGPAERAAVVAGLRDAGLRMACPDRFRSPPSWHPPSCSALQGLLRKLGAGFEDIMSGGHTGSRIKVGLQWAAHARRGLCRAGA